MIKEIIAMYFDKKMEVSDISKALKVSKTTVLKKLREDVRYENEKLMRNERKLQKLKERNEAIRKMYYDEGCKAVEISKFMNICSASVTKIIKDDKRYNGEKERRKLASSVRNKTLTKEIVRRKRREEKEDKIIMSNLALLQKQNAIAMSRKRKLSSEEIVKINLAHYIFNYNKNRLEFDASCGVRTYDLPKSIGVHGSKKSLGKLYEESKV